jgi:hypothetical protein
MNARDGSGEGSDWAEADLEQMREFLVSQIELEPKVAANMRKVAAQKSTPELRRRALIWKASKSEQIIARAKRVLQAPNYREALSEYLKDRRVEREFERVVDDYNDAERAELEAVGLRGASDWYEFKRRALRRWLRDRRGQAGAPAQAKSASAGGNRANGGDNTTVVIDAESYNQAKNLDAGKLRALASKLTRWARQAQTTAAMMDRLASWEKERQKPIAALN